jgi:hypothetical protein
MPESQCPFCGRVNPRDSKFCNECGAPLHLLPCPHCGAVNDATATVCHQCDTPLPEGRTSGLTPSPSGAEASGPAGSAGPTAAGRGVPEPQHAAGADAFDRDARVSAAREELRQLLAQLESAAAAGARDGGNAGSPGPGAGTRMAVAPRAEGLAPYPAPAVGGTPARRIARRVAPQRSSTIVLGTALIAAVVGAGYYAYHQRQAVDIRQSPVATGEVKDRSDPAEAGAPVSPGASTPAPEPARSAPTAAVPPAVAADPKSTRPAADGSISSTQQGSTSQTAGNQQRAAPPTGDRPAASAAVPSVRPRAPDTGAGVVQPPRVGPCTDAVAALGLCTPEPIQRRE